MDVRICNCYQECKGIYENQIADSGSRDAVSKCDIEAHLANQLSVSFFLFCNITDIYYYYYSFISFNRTHIDLNRKFTSSSSLCKSTHMKCHYSCCCLLYTS